jgi:glycosyltransferase involved in cell wall biosynthesis
MQDIYLFRGKHPLYETLLSYPPEGVRYHPEKRASGTEEYSLYGTSHSMVRRLTDTAFAWSGLPRMVPVLRRYDLVHSSRGFIPIGPNRFAVDIEHVSSFVGMHHGRLRSGRVKNTISRALSSPKCSALLPHCEAAKASLSLISRERGLMDKAVVVYPAVDPGLGRTAGPQKGRPRVLFMGEHLWKGGREVMEACALLADKLDFDLTYISLRVHPPEEAVAKAKRGLSIDFFQGPVPRKDLLERILPTVDVFVMPTYIDTFGYAFLEAMAFGIPCVGTRHFAVPEIVEDGVTGLLVDAPGSFFDASGLGHPEMSPAGWDTSKTVAQLRDALSSLIESESLRQRLGREGRRAVAEGKFSIRRRNQVLGEVYAGHVTG